MHYHGDTRVSRMAAFANEKLKAMAEEQLKKTEADSDEDEMFQELNK